MHRPFAAREKYCDMMLVIYCQPGIVNLVWVWQSFFHDW
ncbi:MAG: hypothetical protein JWP96_1613 [Polaromonas sp.]|nr:hypothetical protein [Polaromonas sp.]